MSDDRLLTIRDVIERTSLSRSTVMGLLARGELPSLAIGRARRVQLSQLDLWIAACAAKEDQRRGRAPEARHTDEHVRRAQSTLTKAAAQPEPCALRRESGT